MNQNKPIKYVVCILFLLGALTPIDVCAQKYDVYSDYVGVKQLKSELDSLAYNFMALVLDTSASNDSRITAIKGLVAIGSDTSYQFLLSNIGLELFFEYSDGEEGLVYSYPIKTLLRGAKWDIYKSFLSLSEKKQIQNMEDIALVFTIIYGDERYGKEMAVFLNETIGMRRVLAIPYNMLFNENVKSLKKALE